MEQNSFHLIEQVSEMSKITPSVIVYAPCLSKTIIKTNKKQMNSSADTFFLKTRYREDEAATALSEITFSFSAYGLLKRLPVTHEESVHRLASFSTR